MTNFENRVFKIFSLNVTFPTACSWGLDPCKHS